MTIKQPNTPWQPEINHETSLSDGYRNILIKRLQSLGKVLQKHNKTNTLSPKLVHKIRVGSRRLICAIKLFKQVGSKKLLVKPLVRTKNLMDHFGPMRNWDVFYNACKTYNNQSTSENNNLFLQGAIWANQNRFEKEAIIYMRAKADKLISRLLKTSSKLFTTNNEPVSISFFEWSKLSLMKIVDDFKNSINTIAYSKEELHAFRLKIKFLRYGLEIIGDVIPVETSHSLYDSLKKGQAILGAINDLYFHIEQITFIDASLKNKSLEEGLLKKSFLKHCQQLLETNIGLFRTWQESTKHLIEI
ncbi:MAG: CHAD domain-containing protein [Planctomycetota bacterium]|nr:CHAD domain-containing protein [Planctomycetota bacterium]